MAGPDPVVVGLKLTLAGISSPNCKTEARAVLKAGGSTWTSKPEFRCCPEAVHSQSLPLRMAASPSRWSIRSRVQTRARELAGHVLGSPAGASKMAPTKNAADGCSGVGMAMMMAGWPPISSRQAWISETLRNNMVPAGAPAATLGSNSFLHFFHHRPARLDEPGRFSSVTFEKIQWIFVDVLRQKSMNEQIVHSMSYARIGVELPQ